MLSHAIKCYKMVQHTLKSGDATCESCLGALVATSCAPCLRQDLNKRKSEETPAEAPAPIHKMLIATYFEFVNLASFLV